MNADRFDRIQRALRLVVAAAGAALVILTGASTAQAAAPVKLVLASHFGREVNLTQTLAKGGAALEDICTVESKDECQTGSASSIPGSFLFLEALRPRRMAMCTLRMKATVVCRS